MERKCKKVKLKGKQFSAESSIELSAQRSTTVVQWYLENLQGQGYHKLPGQPVPVISYPHSDKICLTSSQSLPCFLRSPAVHHRKEPGLIFSLTPHGHCGAPDLLFKCGHFLFALNSLGDLANY